MKAIAALLGLLIAALCWNAGGYFLAGFIVLFLVAVFAKS
jgi:hypothetical protein